MRRPLKSSAGNTRGLIEARHRSALYPCGCRSLPRGIPAASLKPGRWRRRPPPQARRQRSPTSTCSDTCHGAMSRGASDPPTIRVTVRLSGSRHSKRDRPCACAPPAPTAGTSAAASAMRPIAEMQRRMCPTGAAARRPDHAPAADGARQTRLPATARPPRRAARGRRRRPPRAAATAGGCTPPSRSRPYVPPASTWRRRVAGR